MNPGLSLYLDALRFGAALIVFVGHYSTAQWGGGLFWQVAPYSRTSVLVFFVLSGFVIAYATEQKERTLRDYAISRMARLWSVIIPALVLTFLLDAAHGSVAPEGFLASALLLGQSWSANLVPGTNSPFWSLNYEFWYYVLFGAWAFLAGPARRVVLVAAALLAGPKILLLFPLWLAGVCAYRERHRISPRTGLTLVISSFAALLCLEIAGGQTMFKQADSPWLPYLFSPYDYIVGALVALNFLGMSRLDLSAVARWRGARVARRIADCTFGLYLFHYPMLIFVAQVAPGAPTEASHRAFVFVFSLAPALTLAWIIEQRKGALKSGLRALWPLPSTAETPRKHYALQTQKSRPGVNRSGLIKLPSVDES